MTLIKTSLLNGIAVIVKMLTLLGINKVLAIYVGPAGYAAIGQFQNAVQIIVTFASGAINTGVTKYTAEHYENEAKQHLIWRTAGTVAMIGSLLMAIIIAIFSGVLAEWVLKDENYRGIFLWFAATLVLFTFNTLLLAILNGKKEVARYVLANIAGSLFSLIVTAIMVAKFGVYGALVSLAIYQSISFFITFAICMNAKWFKISYLLGSLDKETILNLTKYTAMALTSAACIPISHIFIRNHLGEAFGWAEAGHWEAMWRLSGAYLLLVTTTLSVYYLPQLSQLKEPHDIKKEVVQGYKIILPTAAACGLIIYFLRDPVIQILFSAEFLPMRQLFGWQMMGDTFKIGSWLLAYVMLGKAMVKLFIISELAFAISFVALTVLLTRAFGLEGVAMAHAINYAIYWVVIAFFIRKKLFINYHHEEQHVNSQ